MHETMKAALKLLARGTIWEVNGLGCEHEGFVRKFMIELIPAECVEQLTPEALAQLMENLNNHRMEITDYE